MDVKNWAMSLKQLLGPEFDTTSALNDISNMVSDARDFEIKRRKVKANVAIVFGCRSALGNFSRYGFPVDGDAMRLCSSALDVSAAHYGSNVQLIVSPAIMRWGNSCGTDYSERACLLKMVVLAASVPGDVSTHPKLGLSGLQEDGEITSKGPNALTEIVKNEASPKGAYIGDNAPPNDIGTQHGVQNTSGKVESVPKEIKTEPAVQGTQRGHHPSVARNAAMPKQHSPTAAGSSTKHTGSTSCSSRRQKEMCQGSTGVRRAGA